MIASILRRLQIVKSKLTNEEYLKYSQWKDVAHEVCKYYGRSKSGLAANMRITRTAEAAQVEIEGRSIYWPAHADVSRLVDMYFEVFHEGNNHYFDIPEMSVRPGDAVMDCGACEGYFTLKALETGAARVYCIEPGDEIARCLRKTFKKEIAGDRVSIHSCLLGERTERTVFYQHPGDPTIGRAGHAALEGTGHLSSTEVEMTTIDEFCGRFSMDKLDFVKADVEGSEVGLVKGAEKTIRRFRPALAIAVYHAPENANRIVDFIKGLSLGYTIRVKGIVSFDNIPRPVMVHCYQARTE